MLFGVYYTLSNLEKVDDGDLTVTFNLYNSFCSDSFENDMPSVNFTPVDLFCSEYAEYYVEALRIRFPEFFEGGF